MIARPASGTRAAAGLFLAVAAVLVITVWQSAEHLAPGEAGLTTRVSLPALDDVLGPWLFWDAGAHHDIAEHGYTDADVKVFEAGGQARVAYFPGYPAAARAVGAVVGNVAVGLMVVTFLSGLAIAVLYDRWLRRMVSATAARYGLAALLLFPWAYFLVAAGYGDALFLLTALGAFLLLEDDRPLAAGLVGALASGSRFVGVAVVIGLVVRTLELRGVFERGREGWAWSRLRRRDAGVLVSVSGLLGYIGFCWWRYGDPLAFSTAQRGWNQGTGPRTWFKLRLFELIQDSPDTGFVLRLVLQGVVVIIFCAALPAVWRRFGPGYGAYTTVALALPVIGSAAFASQGRYVLAAFPVFALLGERLVTWRPAARTAYFVGSGATLIAFASFWARGYWMG